MFMTRGAFIVFALGLALPLVGARAEPFASADNVADAGWHRLSEEDVAQRAQALARDTMSPFCPGKTIDSCPSPRAQAWREDMRTWLAQGASTTEVRNRLQARVPDFDLEGRPGRAWDWILPIGCMVLASLWLATRVRLTRPRSELPETGTSKLQDESGENARLDAQLDAELARLLER